MRPFFPKLKIRPLFADSGADMPNINQRIANISALGRVNMIIIDGKAQTGKSTLARKIASEHDPDYILVFTVQDILDYLKKAKELWFAGEYGKVRGKWIFYDEPQLQANKKEFWSARNLIIEAFTSSFGFLKNNLIMALPNIKGLNDIVLTNISMRISVKSFLQKREGIKTIVRKGYVKIPLFDERHNKFIWATVEDYTIPAIADDNAYDNKKAHNFFDNALVEWENRLIKEKNTKPYDPFLPRDCQ